MTRTHPFGHGRLSYVQIPAINVRDSAAFYKTIFSWQARGDGTDHLGFTDATGDMIGAYYRGEHQNDERGQRYGEIAAYLREKESPA